MKSYLIAYGVGTLLAVVGGVLWMMSNEKYGLILILSGITVGVLGLVMMLIEWGMNKGKKPAAS